MHSLAVRRSTSCTAGSTSCTHTYKALVFQLAKCPVVGRSILWKRQPSTVKRSPDHTHASGNAVARPSIQIAAVGHALPVGWTPTLRTGHSLADEQDDRIEPGDASSHRRGTHIGIRPACIAPSALELRERFHGARATRHGGVAKKIAKVGFQRQLGQHNALDSAVRHTASRCLSPTVGDISVTKR